jgi:hypothetical protein
MSELKIFKEPVSSEEKLAILYGMRAQLHPLTLVVIVGLVEVQKGVLGPYDKEYVETVYSLNLRNRQ